MADIIALGANDNNDIYLDSNGNMAIAEDLDAVLQACEQACKTLLGELVLQNNIGIPYFQSVFSGAPNVGVFNASLRSAITSIPGVIQVISLEIEQVAEDLTYNAAIETQFGRGSING